ncbi:MAG: DUF302 domain-containing protein, partial [Chitinophagales bacterium]
FALDIISIPSSHSVSETMNQLQNAFLSKGITVYTRIDQKAEALKAGLELKAMEPMIFGNPKSGIPLMNKEPLVGLDLPLKVLAWESAENKVWVSFNSANYLQHRFTLPDDLMKPIAAVEGLIRNTLQP